MKILAFTDVHLDAVTAGVERFEEIADVVARVVELAIDRSVDVVAFLGDWCDPDSACVHRAVALAVRVACELHARGIATLWLPGNHDVIEDGSGSSTLSALGELRFDIDNAPCVLLHKPQVFRFTSGLAIVALPFAPRVADYDPQAFVRDAAVKPDEKVVVLSHLNIEGIGPGSECGDFARGRNVFLPLADIRARWPRAVVLNGHIHKPQTFDGVNVVGSLVRLRFDEACNATGAMLLRL